MKLEAKWYWNAFVLAVWRGVARIAINRADAALRRANRINVAIINARRATQ